MRRPTPAAVLILLLASALPLSAARAHPLPGARCLRVSGAGATRCLAAYTATVGPCRERADLACEQAAQPPAGALARVLAAPDAADHAACTDADADALGYVSAGDVVLRTHDACGDYASDL